MSTEEVPKNDARKKSWRWHHILISIILVLIVCRIFITAAAVPTEPTYTLTAITEKITLGVHRSPSTFSWNGLSVKKIDGTESTCPISQVLIGAVPVEIELELQSGRALGDKSPQPFTIVIRPRSSDQPFRVECMNGEAKEVKSNLVLQAISRNTPLTLPFSGNITAGGQIDTASSSSLILLSGSVRATAKLMNSSQPGAASQFDLFAGDVVNVTSRNANALAATGLIWQSEQGLNVVAHGAGLLVALDRPGIGRIEEVGLEPGLVAILLADRTLLLLCTVLATALTFFPTAEHYLRRLWAWWVGTSSSN